MKIRIYKYLILLSVLFLNCTVATDDQVNKMENKGNKEVVYQVFTRLFGNKITNNKPWGTIKENGVGKFNDFTTKALHEIKDLGVTHIWYTGVLHHATITDYSDFGISMDDPDVVKGRAGSPFAIKDYYNVDPDLAENPSKRLEEFQQLIDRTHMAGLKVLIDIVPNHIARKYEGKTNPESVLDFGANDDTSIVYSRDNNFYYVPDKNFEVPSWINGYKPLGGESHVLADGKFEEIPAKWTGNGSRSPQPTYDDWYETIKINYGIRPDGSKDFEELPEGFEFKDYEEHWVFWKDKDVPDSWKKFRDIALYWLEKGVDGFRFDMAEMVPVEFWSFLNSSIKMKNSEAFLLAEVYNPTLYRDYIHKGKIDYLYDKVALYDTIKHIVKGHGLTDNIPPIQEDLKDIEHHMLHFMENHDEQRIASPGFADSAEKGKPAMVVSATINSAPTMIYFGQEVGEPAVENSGFGEPTRTSHYDYIGVPHHQRWMNMGKFDGGLLTEQEKNLRDFYKRLLNLTIKSDALMGEYSEIHNFNRENTKDYNHKLFSFVRWSKQEKLVIISNFDNEKSFNIDLQIPAEIVEVWKLEDSIYTLKDQLYEIVTARLKVKNGIGVMNVKIDPLASFIFKIDN